MYVANNGRTDTWSSLREELNCTVQKLENIHSQEVASLREELVQLQSAARGPCCRDDARSRSLSKRRPVPAFPSWTVSSAAEDVNVEMPSARSVGRLDESSCSRSPRGKRQVMALAKGPQHVSWTAAEDPMLDNSSRPGSRHSLGGLGQRSDGSPGGRGGLPPRSDSSPGGQGRRGSRSESLCSSREQIHSPHVEWLTRPRSCVGILGGQLPQHSQELTRMQQAELFPSAVVKQKAIVPNRTLSSGLSLALASLPTKDEDEFKEQEEEDYVVPVSGELKTEERTHKSRITLFWGRKSTVLSSHWQYAGAGDRWWWQPALRNLIKNVKYEGVMCIFVFLGFVLMGLDQEVALKGGAESPTGTALFVLENILTTIFVVEVVAKLVAFGRGHFSVRTLNTSLNLADALVVLIARILPVWLMPMFGHKFYDDGDAGWGLRTLMLFRVLRLARLYRVVQVIPWAHDIALILRGLVSSMTTFLWAIFTIACTDYIFAVFGLCVMGRKLHELDAAAHGEDEELHHLLELFGDISSAMYSLAEILTIEGFNPHLLRPMQKYIPWAWFYFMSYLAVMHLLLLNLITAMVVENALSNSKVEGEKEQAKKEDATRKEMDQLNELFVMMDDNGDGTLSWQEFKSAFKNEQIRNIWKCLDFRPEECRELFHLLDKGDGVIPIEDFFDGLRRMKGVAQSKDIFRIMKQLRDLATGLNAMPPAQELSTLE